MQGALTVRRFAGMAGTVVDNCKDGHSQFSIKHLKMEQLWIMNKEHLVFGPECTTANKYAVYQQIVDDMNDLTITQKTEEKMNGYYKVMEIDRD